MMYLMRLFPPVLFALAFALPSSAWQDESQAVVRFEPSPTPETLPRWEARLQADPDNLELRGSVSAYYAQHGPAEKFVEQLLWVVQHHPESPIATLSSSAAPGDLTLPAADYGLVKAAWEQALIDHADSGRVLRNAGLFFARQDPLKAVHLLEQARQLETDNPFVLSDEANLYVRVTSNPPHEVSTMRRTMLWPRQTHKPFRRS